MPHPLQIEDLLSALADFVVASAYLVVASACLVGASAPKEKQNYDNPKAIALYYVTKIVTAHIKILLYNQQIQPDEPLSQPLSQHKKNNTIKMIIQTPESMFLKIFIISPFCRSGQTNVLHKSGFTYRPYPACRTI